MDESSRMILAIEPSFIERARGGWLAVSPRRSIVAIGVVGRTEDEARRKFSEALERWARARGDAGSESTITA